MRCAVINYGMGNLASICRAVEATGRQAFVATRPEDLADVTRVILPGVGAFGEAMERLEAGGWPEALTAFSVLPDRRLLGICLGMQMLATIGTEHGRRSGLGLIAGEVVPLREFGVTDRVPHVGWNEVALLRDDPLMQTVPDRTDFYFVHSFAFRPDREEDLVAVFDYGVAVPAVVRRDRVWGCQFHPEKSSKAGRRILENFLSDAAC